MGEIMISDVVKDHEASLHGGTTPFNIMSQLHHKSDILGHRAGGEEHEIFREYKLGFIFDNSGIGAWRVLLLETPTSGRVAG